MATSARRHSIEVFRSHSAALIDDDGMMTNAPVQIDEEVTSQPDIGRLADGQRVTVLFKGSDESGFSLVRAKFSPGYRLPRHSHNADCLYYVVEGEAHLGSQELRAGDGFMVAADSPYAYAAGPDGVTVLEFRVATTFDIRIRDSTLRQWQPVLEAMRTHGHTWPSPDSQL